MLEAVRFRRHPLIAPELSDARERLRKLGALTRAGADARIQVKVDEAAAIMTRIVPQSEGYANNVGVTHSPHRPRHPFLGRRPR